MVSNRKSHQPAGITIDHGGKIHIAATGYRQVGNVADEHAIRRRGMKLPANKIWKDTTASICHGGAHATFLREPLDAHSLHDACNAFVIDHRMRPRIRIVQRRGDALSSVESVFLTEHSADTSTENSIVKNLLAARGLCVFPLVIGRSPHLQHVAHPLDRILGAMVPDELEADHKPISFAKYCAALRRMSRSS